MQSKLGLSKLYRVLKYCITGSWEVRKLCTVGEQENFPFLVTSNRSRKNINIVITYISVLQLFTGMFHRRLGLTPICSFDEYTAKKQ